jgi:hypothetical protein
MRSRRCGEHILRNNRILGRRGKTGGRRRYHRHLRRSRIHDGTGHLRHSRRAGPARTGGRQRRPVADLSCQGQDGRRSGNLAGHLPVWHGADHRTSARWAHRTGQKVLVTAGCQDPGFISSKVISPVLATPDLRRNNGDSVTSLLTADGRVHKNARPGTYPISFTCAGRQVTGTFTVERAAQVPVKPKGAPETGA